MGFIRPSIGGVFKNLTFVRLMHTAAWKDVTFIRVYKTVNNHSGWHDTYVKAGSTPTPSPAPTPTPTPTPAVTLSVTPSPTNISGTRVGTGIVYTNTSTVNVTKGTPPYTYVFSKSTYSGSIAPTLLVGSSPNIIQASRNMDTIDDTETATIKCSVTDSKGNKGSCLINATFISTFRENTGGIGTVNGGINKLPGGVQPSN